MKRKILFLIFCIIIISIAVNAFGIEYQSKKIKEKSMSCENNSGSFTHLSYYPHCYNFSDQYEGITANTTFQIWNSGCCGLTYIFIEECPWIEISPDYGYSRGEKDIITVTINTTNLSIGFHSYDILIDTNVEDGLFTISVNVTMPPNNKPHEPVLTGPSSGEYGSAQIFTATSNDPDNNQIWYKWDFGDGNVTDWIGPYDANVTSYKKHTWYETGVFNVKVKTRDKYFAESNWSTLKITIVAAELEIVSFKNVIGGISFTIENNGQSKAKNLTSTILIKGGLLSGIHLNYSFIGDSDYDSTLHPGKQKTITSTEKGFIFGIGPIDVTIFVSADNSKTINLTEKSFVIGPLILNSK